MNQHSFPTPLWCAALSNNTASHQTCTSLYSCCRPYNRAGFPAPARSGQDNQGDALSLSRVLHHVFLRPALSRRHLRRVVVLFSAVSLNVAGWNILTNACCFSVNMIIAFLSHRSLLMQRLYCLCYQPPPFCGDRAGSVIAINSSERTRAAAAGDVASGVVGEEGNIFSARARRVHAILLRIRRLAHLETAREASCQSCRKTRKKFGGCSCSQTINPKPNK